MASRSNGKGKGKAVSTSAIQTPLEVPPDQLDSSRFPNKDAQTRYFKYFSGRTLVLERPVRLDELHDLKVAKWLKDHQWDGILTIDTQANLTVVKEFFSGFKKCSSWKLRYRVRGKTIFLTPKLIGNTLNIPVVKDYEYPIPANEDTSANETRMRELASLLTGNQHSWSGTILKSSHLTLDFALLNRIVCHNILPTTHYSEVHYYRALFLSYVAGNRKISLPHLIIDELKAFDPDDPKVNATGLLPFGKLITKICEGKLVPSLIGDVWSEGNSYIGLFTVRKREAQIQSVKNAPVHSGDEANEEMDMDDCIGVAEAEEGGSSRKRPARSRSTMTHQLSDLSSSIGDLSVQIDTRFAALNTELQAYRAYSNERFDRIDGGIADLRALMMQRFRDGRGGGGGSSTSGSSTAGGGNGDGSGGG